MSEEELEPCPFCGEAKDLSIRSGFVGCGTCGASAGSLYKTDDVAAKIWNTRTTEQAHDRIVELEADIFRFTQQDKE